MAKRTGATKGQRVWDVPCQRCGHVTMRYWGDPPPTRADFDWRAMRYLDGGKLPLQAQSDCPECGEQHLDETFDAARWSEYKDYDGEMTRLPTHGHQDDSPFAAGGAY